MSDMAPEGTGGDWMDDESVSFDDAHARFEALQPHATVAPAPTSLPGNSVFIASRETFGAATTLRPEVRRFLGRRIGSTATLSAL